MELSALGVDFTRLNFGPLRLRNSPYRGGELRYLFKMRAFGPSNVR